MKNLLATNTRIRKTETVNVVMQWWYNKKKER